MNHLYNLYCNIPFLIEVYCPLLTYILLFFVFRFSLINAFTLVLLFCPSKSNDLLSHPMLFHTQGYITSFYISFSPLTAILSFFLAKHLFPCNSSLRTPLSPPLKTSTTNNNITIYYIKKDSIYSTQFWPVSVTLNNKTALCSVKKLYLTTRTPFT